MSELVYRLNTSYLVTVSSKIFQVACKCCRITAHVHNPLRIHFDNRIKKCLIAALSRRVNNHNIRINPHYRLKGGWIGQSRTFFWINRLIFRFLHIFIINTRHNLFCLADKKFSIIKRIAECVIFCILYRLWNNLDTVYLSCLCCHKKRYCSYSAIQIPDRLISRKFCIFKSFTIKLFRLHRIDLKKWEWWNSEHNPADTVLDIGIPPYYWTFTAKNNISSFLINVNHNWWHSADIF